MTIQHFAFAKFKAGVSDADKQSVVAQTRELIARIPGVRRSNLGLPIDPAYAQGYGFALTLEFDDTAGFKAYLPHPEHKKLLKLLRQYTDPASTLSYQIDSSATAKL